MESWSTLCRCCLSPDSGVSLLDKENNVKDIFYEITSIEVDEADGLPQRLCDNCHELLNSAHMFRTQCIKMDSELRIQLDAMLNKVKKQIKEDNHEKQIATKKSLDNDVMKQLASFIKEEPIEIDDDDDDDCYYVVVIDDKEGEVTSDGTSNENVIEKEIKKEFVKNAPEETSDSYHNTYEYMLSNNKVPANVPATILENEEEGHESEGDYDYEMDFDTQDSASQDQNIDNVNYSELEPEVQIISSNLEGELTEHDKNNIIKILSAKGSDGTILLRGEDGIQYLTTNSELTNENGETVDLNQEEVILYEGDDSQYQILKCDGSELVIEYADGDQIATVLEQDDGSFLCDCGQQFTDLGEFEKHQYTHNPAGEFLCTLCGKGFESEEILTGHMLLHSCSGTVVKCPYCDQLIKRNTLTQHIKYGHNDAKPECHLCYKTFANPNNLKRHMMIHSGVKEFECDICLKRFHQKITMQTHKLTHINPFACSNCELSFDTKAELQEHKETNECTNSRITKAKEKFLTTVKQEVTTNLGKLLGYACSLCQKMFSLEAALDQHVERAHMFDPSELLCNECNEIFTSKKELQSHILTHKTYKTKNLKRFECKECGKGCSSQAMLIMHERVHTNERPFPCGLCALRFKTKTHLRTHQLTHTREKKFGCSVCMKFFALKGNLVVHLRTHTGERPYVCGICGEAFIDSKYLKKHKLKKHSIDNVPWNQY